MAIIINDEVKVKYDFKDIFDEIFKIVVDKLNLTKDYDFSVSFISDKKIREINSNYRNIDKETDVISFAMLDSEDIVNKDISDLDLGDIFISVDTALRQAESLNQSLEREIIFLFTHGLLHLLGYDHQSEEDEKVMFKLQEEIIYEVTNADNRKI